MKDKMKKILALVFAAILGIAAGCAGYGLYGPEKTVEVEKLVEVSVPGPVEYITETVEVPVEVEKVVEVDNGNLDKVLTYLEDNYGDEDVFEDAEDIVMKIDMEDNAKALALGYLEENWFDMLDDFGFRDGEFDSFRVREIKLYKVYKDYEDIELLDIDYDDEKFEVRVEFKVKAEDADDDNDDLTMKFIAEFEIEGDDVDVIDMYED